MEQCLQDGMTCGMIHWQAMNCRVRKEMQAHATWSRRYGRFRAPQDIQVDELCSEWLMLRCVDSRIIQSCFYIARRQPQSLSFLSLFRRPSGLIRSAYEARLSPERILVVFTHKLVSVPTFSPTVSISSASSLVLQSVPDE